MKKIEVDSPHFEFSLYFQYYLTIKRKKSNKKTKKTKIRNTWGILHVIKKKVIKKGGMDKQQSMMFISLSCVRGILIRFLIYWPASLYQPCQRNSRSCQYNAKVIILNVSKMLNVALVTDQESLWTDKRQSFKASERVWKKADGLVLW